jgi:hypothetical protein
MRGPVAALVKGDADPQRQPAETLRPPPEEKTETLVDVGTRVLEVQIGRAAGEPDLDLGVRTLGGRGSNRKQQRKHDRADLARRRARSQRPVSGESS